MTIKNPITQLQPMKRESISTRVREAIRELIIINNLQPGDALPPEGEIASQLEVSRTSVREAISSLEALGIVEVRHGHGIFVKGFDFDALMESLSYSLAVKGRHIEELLEVREALEVAFVPSVVANITDREIRQLEDLVAQMEEKAVHGEAFPEEDQQFHLILYQSTGNDLLLKLIRIFWLAVHRLRAAQSDQGQIWDVEPDLTSQDHADILEALKLGDVDLMRQRIVAHYEPMRRQLNEQSLELDHQ